MIEYSSGSSEKEISTTDDLEENSYKKSDKKNHNDYLRGFHNKSMKRDNKFYRRGKKKNIYHKYFMKGAKAALGNKKIKSKHEAYINGYNYPQYIKYRNQPFKKWIFKENIKIPNIRGFPNRSGICVVSKNKQDKLVVLVGINDKGLTLVGGKAKKNEHILHCARREFDEETKYLFRESKIILLDCHKYDSTHVLFLVKVPYICLKKFNNIHGTICEEEFDKLEWIEKDILMKSNKTVSYVKTDLEFWNKKYFSKQEM